MTEEISHDRGECGCDDIRNNNHYFVVGVAGFALLALMLVYDGMLYIGTANDQTWAIDFQTMFTTFQSVAVIFAALAAIYGFLGGIHAKSLLLVLVATEVGAFIVLGNAGFTINTDRYMLIDILIAVFILMPAAVFIIKKERLLAVACIIFAIGLSISYLFPDINSGVTFFGATALVSGLIFAYISLANMIFIETGKELPVF